jgi:hypothetical protein
MMKYTKVVVILLSAGILVSGCARCPQIDPQLKLITHFDDYMVPLAKAVDAIADQLPAEAKDQEILNEIVRRSGSKDLIQPFDGYVFKARLENGVGIILLCTPDGKEGIIEDATCTTGVDTWRPPKSPCAYLLDAERACSVP